MRQHRLARVDVAQVQQRLVGGDPSRCDQLGLLILPDELRVGFPAVAQPAVRAAVELLLGEPGAGRQAGIRLAGRGLLEAIRVGGNAEEGIRIGIVDVVDAVVLVQERMTVGVLAGILGRFGKLWRPSRTGWSGD